MSTSHDQPSTSTLGPRQPRGPQRGSRVERSGPASHPSRRPAKLRVLVADERGRSVAANGLASWLRRVAPVSARGTVNIALVSDRRIRTLNRTYRRKDYATDVLSFAAASSSPPLRTRRKKPVLSSVSSVSSVVESFLGDIVIARGVAKRQAREAGHGEATE